MATRTSDYSYQPQRAADDINMRVPAADLGAAYQPQPVAGLGANRDTSQIYPTRDTPSKQHATHITEWKKHAYSKEEEKEIEEEIEEAKEEKYNLRSGLIITGVVVAVIGAIFVVFKNIKKA